MQNIPCRQVWRTQTDKIKTKYINHRFYLEAKTQLGINYCKYFWFIYWLILFLKLPHSPDKAPECDESTEQWCRKKHFDHISELKTITPSMHFTDRQQIAVLRCGTGAAAEAHSAVQQTRTWSCNISEPEPRSSQPHHSRQQNVNVSSV